MKILYYSPHPLLSLDNDTGYAVHMGETIKAFREIGHEVLPVTMGGSKNVSFNSKSGGHSFIKKFMKAAIPSYAWESMKDYMLLRHDVRAGIALMDVVRKYQPDLLYERGNYLQLSGTKVSLQTGTKHILEVNAPFSEERNALQGNSWYLRRSGRVEEEQLLSAHKVVTVSSALSNYYISRFSLNPAKFIVLPNAVDPSQADSVSPEKTARIRKKYGLENSIVVGFSGSILAWHGIDILIKAFAAVLRSENRRTLKLIIVGDGETLPSARNLAAALGVADSIIFTGSVPRSEVCDYVSVMDVAVMAKSNWYGSPVKIFEYGLMGKAIIAPDTDPVKEVMNDGEDGILVAPAEESVASALKKILSDEGLGKSMGERFRKKVLAFHTWKRNAEKILESFS